MALYTPVVEGATPAERLFISQQEIAQRKELQEEEATSLQALLFHQYLGALAAASTAQRALAQPRPPAVTQGAWQEASFGWLLQDEFTPAANNVSELDGLLPPSLTNRRTPRSTSSIGDAPQSFASLTDLGMADDKMYSFRRHFDKTPGVRSSTALSSPPLCWSSATLTPATLRSTPGLTPSPAWSPAPHPSPSPASPRFPLPFPDLSSPPPTHPKEGSRHPISHPWPSSP